MADFTCHVCGAFIAGTGIGVGVGICESCGHPKCVECPPYVPRPSYDELERELAQERTRREEAEGRLSRITDWCEAYPLEVFPKPDMDEVRRKLGDTLLTQLSADCMRHVVEGVAKIAAPPQEGERHG